MKIGIYGGEAFPVYEVHDKESYTAIEIDQETFNRWKEAFSKFSEVQQEIVDEMDKQGCGSEVWARGIWNGFHLE